MKKSAKKKSLPNKSGKKKAGRSGIMAIKKRKKAMEIIREKAKNSKRKLKDLVISHDLEPYLQFFYDHFRNMEGLIGTLNEYYGKQRFAHLMQIHDVPIVSWLDLMEDVLKKTKPAGSGKSIKKKRKMTTSVQKSLKELLISHDLGDYINEFEHHFKNTDGIIKVMKYDEKNKTDLFFDLMFGEYDVPIVRMLSLRETLMGE